MIKIICVGKVKEKYLRELGFNLNEIDPYLDLTIIYFD